jgi:ribosomal protein S18 acetylase RimI-like enzyme
LPPQTLKDAMTNGITIRQADERDTASLELCFDELQSFEQSIESNRAEPSLIRNAYIRGLFDDCAMCSGAIFVAEAGSRIVGFVCVLSRLDSEDIIERDREHAYVTDLVVLEPYRKAGIASELMHVAEAHASSSGARRLRVGVLAANGGAHKLYRKLGYRDQEIVLEKTLDPQEAT